MKVYYFWDAQNIKQKALTCMLSMGVQCDHICDFTQMLYDTSHFVFLFCVCLKACVLGDINSWTHTHTLEWMNYYWDHQVLSHPTHVQYPGYAHSLTGKKKTHESCISKRCTAISFMSCEFVNWKPYLGSEGKNETVSGWHCACELASDGVHTARYAVLSFFFWILFFHTVPSLQQNIHIKTLADDMVRCSV